MPPRHLYVHVPFCARRCSYCDFAIAVRRRVPVDEYLCALERELVGQASEGVEIDTLYLGGGTPSLIGTSGISRLLALLAEHARPAAAAEITLEANPDDVTRRAARDWRDAGVTRVSLGAQSFDPRALRWMHRTHESWQIVKAVESLRSAGIERISLDLIFALPEALGRSWERDVQRALELRPGHLSFYGLTVEPATPLARWVARGAAAEAPEERYETEFMRAHELLAAAGYDHYEVSSYALPGERSRHNSCYWTHAEYLGVGPSAHSFEGGVRRWNARNYAEWLRLLMSGASALAGEERLTEENLRAERVYLGLRTDRGVQVDEAAWPRVLPWVSAGWARVEGGNVVRLTPSGWLRLDALAADLTYCASPSYI